MSLASCSHPCGLRPSRDHKQAVATSPPLSPPRHPPWGWRLPPPRPTPPCSSSSSGRSPGSMANIVGLPACCHVPRPGRLSPVVRRLTFSLGHHPDAPYTLGLPRPEPCAPPSVVPEAAVPSRLRRSSLSSLPQPRPSAQGGRVPSPCVDTAGHLPFVAAPAEILRPQVFRRALPWWTPTAQPEGGGAGAPRGPPEASVQGLSLL